MKIAEAYAEIKVKDKPYLSQLKNMETATKRSTDRMQQKFQALGPTFRKVGIGMAVAGGAITAALGLAIKSSMSFNKEMANIATLIPGATKRVIELKGAIRTMAVTVGKDTADLAQGAYQVISAFGDTADTVAILKMSAKAATAGVATTTSAINLLSAVTKGYGDTSKEAVQKASDLAFMTVKLGQTDFPQLEASIGRVIPLAAEMGVTEEELFAVMATGTGVTGKAAEVSTQLRGAIQSLMAPTADMIILLEKEGYASGKAMLADLGLAGSLELVKKRADESNTPLQKYISSIEGQTIALALTGTQADTYREKLEAMMDVTGMTDIAFKEQTEGINKAGFAFEQAKIRIGVLGQEIGDRLLPMITPLIEKITDLVKRMSDWAKEHPKLSSGIVKFAAVLGPLLIGLGGLMMILPGLVAIAPAVGAAFTIMTGPIGIIVMAIAAATAAFIYFYKTNEKFRDYIDKSVAGWILIGKVIWEFVKVAGANLKNWADWLLTNLPKAFAEMGANIIAILTNIGSNIGKAVGRFVEIIKHPIKAMKGELEEIDWTPIFEGVKWTVEGIPPLVEMELGEAVAEYKARIKEIEEVTVTGMKEVAEKAGAGATDIAEQIIKGMDPLKALPGTLKKVNTEAANFITTIENMGIASIKTYFGVSMLEGLLKSMPGVVEKVETKTADYITAIKNMGVATIETFFNLSRLEGLLKSLPGPLIKVKDRTADYISAIKDMGIAAVKTYFGISMLQGLLKSLPGVVEKITIEAVNFIKAIENLGIATIKTYANIATLEGLLKSIAGPLVKVKNKTADYISAIEGMGVASIKTYSGVTLLDGLLKSMPGPLVKVKKKTDDFIAAIKQLGPVGYSSAKKVEESWKALKKSMETLGWTAEGILNAIASSFNDAKNASEAFGKSMLNVIALIPGVGGIAVAVFEILRQIADLIMGVQQATKVTEWFVSKWNMMYAQLRASFSQLGDAFKYFGEVMHETMLEARRDMADLVQSQEDLQLSTRDKLIKELDNYYDYRVLKEMDLTQLLELSAETRAKIEAGTLEEVAETAEETAEREKDAKVGMLQAIEDAYEKESKMIEKKMKLLEIEIMLLEAAALAEEGRHMEASKLRQQAIKELHDLMAAEEEEIDTILDTKDALEDLGETFGDTARGMARDWKDMTDEQKRKARETWGRNGVVPTAIKHTTEAMISDWTAAEEKVGRDARDTWGTDGVVPTALAEATAEMTKDMRDAIYHMIEEMRKLPRRLDFDVFGKLHMPDIPEIGPRYFDIFGRYRAPSIPEAQRGIPYIPRTMPVIVHKKEAILTAPQAREWRAGRGAGQGGTQIVYERGAIRMTVMGGINKQVDLEKAMDYLARKQAEKMRRP